MFSGLKLAKSLHKQTLILLIFMATPCFGQYCKFDPNFEQVVQGKLTSQDNSLVSLKSILSKEKRGSVPVSALFSIDLKNNEAIKNRINELSKSSEKTLRESPPFKKWITCFKNNASISSAIQNQLAIDQLKIQILELPEDERSNLLSLYQIRFSQSKDLTLLDSEQTAVKNNQQKATERLEKAESDASQNTDGLEKEFAGNKAILENFLVDLENNQLSFIEYKIFQTQKYGQVKDELAKVTSLDTDQSNAEIIRVNYEKASEIWRELVDHIFELYLSNKFFAVPSTPQIHLLDGNIELLSKNEQEARNEYTQSINTIGTRLNEINANRIEYIQKEKEMISSLLLQAGSVRSNLFKRCRILNCKDLFQIDEMLLKDIGREVKIVPFKLFALGISKSLETKRKMELGMKGWVDLTVQLLSLTLLLLLPIVFLYLLRWVSRQLDSFRRNLINRSMFNYRYRTKVALWISRLNPFLPWAGMLLFTYLARNILLKTDISELGELIFYLGLYFWYRIFLLLLGSLFEIVFPQKDLESLQFTKQKIHKTSLTIARILFVEVAVLHATSNAVREAYVYTILISLIWYVNIGLLLFVSKRWKNEIFSMAGSIFSGNVFRFVEKRKDKTYSVLLTPLLLIAIILQITLSNIYKKLSTLDFVKWINSEVFKKRLEQSADLTKEESNVPQEYIRYFDFRNGVENENYVLTANSPENNIVESFHAWRNKKSDDDAIILHGNRGLGKSTLASHISEKLKDFSIHHFIVPPKTTQTVNFYSLLSKGIGVEIKNSLEFFEFDRSLEQKTIIFLDDTQNLFLSHIDGLNAYRELQDIVNLQTNNIFWCIILNSKSWNYVKGVFGPEHFYGKVIELRSWSDSEIQQLILSRHEKSGYKKRFDDSIKAFSEDDNGAFGSQAEIQFFRLLWGQSRGNPRSALVYWLTALKADYDPKSIRIGVPKFLSSSLVAGLSDDALFVLAAITKHENLSHPEVTIVTGISESITKKCLKQCENRELIWNDEFNRFRINPRAQYLVDFYLLGRNFIHE